MPTKPKSHSELMKPKRLREKRPSSSAMGYGSQWRKLRAFILNREPLCRHCAENGHTELASDLDHIVPKAQGGTDDPDNLQPLCHSCHSRKTATEDGGFGHSQDYHA